VKVFVRMNFDPGNSGNSGPIVSGSSTEGQGWNQAIPVVVYFKLQKLK